MHNIFNPSGLSNTQATQLTDLLDRLDDTAAKRKAYLDTGRTAALKAWFENPQACTARSDFTVMYQAIPEERFVRMVDDAYRTCGTEEEQKLGQRLQALPFEEKRKAYAFVTSSYADFIDNSRDGDHWNKTAGLYKTILTRYPDILGRQEDFTGAIRFASLVKESQTNLAATWKNAAAQTQMDDTRTLLAQAYPDDDVGRLHIAQVSTKNVLAAFATPADTIVLGQPFFKTESPDLPLFFLTHEFQHRRQIELKKRLPELHSKSPEYYQARLFSANFNGGYLSLALATNKLNRAAKHRAYLEQPVEMQANMIAKMVSIASGTQSAALWEAGERKSMLISDIARPVDCLARNIHRVYSAATGARRHP